MSVHHKSLPFEFKSLDEEAGTFEALVSVFGNVDSVGDRIVPGAFSKSLEQWRGAGDPIPVIFNHDWGTPDAHIGVANPSDVTETEKGLWVKGQLDVVDNPVARQVHRLMKRRSLREFSFGYRVPDGGQKRAEDGANELLQIDLVEVGPTLKGANPETELHAVKSALEEQPDPLEDFLCDLRDGWEAVDHELPEKTKEDLTRKAMEILGVKQEVEKTDEEPIRARSVDPLRKRSDETVLDVQSDGLSQRKSPTTKPEPELEPAPEAELRKRSRDLMLELLTGVPT